MLNENAEQVTDQTKQTTDPKPDPPYQLLLGLLVVVWRATSELSQLQVRKNEACLLYTSPSPRDRTRSRMPSSA